MPDHVLRPEIDEIAAAWALLNNGGANAAYAAAQAILRSAPDCAAAHHLCGEALYRLRRIPAAEAHLDHALALGAAADDLAQTRWMCAMLQGAFERAWRISDGVLHRRAGRPCRHLPHHLRWVWTGAPLAGRRVLVRCYHGLGDTLQCARFIPVLASCARFVAVEAQAALLPLLASLPGIDALIPLDGAAPPYDVDIEALELPHALRLTPATLPATVPYLTVPARLIAAAARHVTGLERHLKVGLVWAAGAWRPERSLPLSSFAAFDALPGLALFSLQRGPALAELSRAVQPRFAAPPLANDDILETAALMMQLDLVVSVDTMAAHLAGALGRPVWTLLPFAADWRWMLDRRDSPWYPTMRLFRQPKPGAWRPVVDEIAAALARLLPRSSE
jgi:hypothetical protein